MRHRVGAFHCGPTPTPLVSTQTNSVDRKSTRLNSSHITISYAVFCLKKKTQERVRHSLGPGRVLIAHQLVQDGGNDLPADTEPFDEPAEGLRLASSLEQCVQSHAGSS